MVEKTFQTNKHQRDPFCWIPSSCLYYFKIFSTFVDITILCAFRSKLFIHLKKGQNLIPRKISFSDDIQVGGKKFFRAARVKFLSQMGVLFSRP